MSGLDLEICLEMGRIAQTRGANCMHLRAGKRSVFCAFWDGELLIKVGDDGRDSVFTSVSEALEFAANWAAGKVEGWEMCK